MIDAFILDLRERIARRSGDEWLCGRCDSRLTDTDLALCPACSDLSAQEEEARRQEQRRVQWEAGCHKQVASVLEQLPQGRHTLTAESTAAVIDRRLHRFVATYQPSKGSALLIGASGSGKTSANSRIVRRLCEERLDALLAQPTSIEARRAFREAIGIVWTTASAIVRALSEHRLGAGEEPGLVRRAVDATLLVLDECGPESPHRAGEIFDIIDRRSTRALPTLVTSGLTAQAFEERYGSGAFRRITEQGLGHLFDLHPATRGRGG